MRKYVNIVFGVLICVGFVYCGSPEPVGTQNDSAAQLLSTDKLDNSDDAQLLCNIGKGCHFPIDSCNVVCLQQGCAAGEDCAMGDTAYDVCVRSDVCNFPDAACNKICESQGCDEASACSLEAANI